MLRRRLHPGRGIRIAKQVWYVRREAKRTRVFRVRRGRVRELGIASRRLAKGRKATRRLLKSF